MNWSKEEFARYTRDKVAMTDFITAMEYKEEKGKQEGRQEGEQIGITKGKEEEKKELARKLLQMGVIPSDKVTEVTGLSIEEVKKIEKNL